MELLEAHQLTRYRRGDPLFQPLELRLRSGTRLGVVGPNGCGKSTLLRTLAQREPPDEGRVVRAPGVRLAYLPQALTIGLAGTVWEAAAAGLQAVNDAERRLRYEERRLALGEGGEQALAEALVTFEALGGYGAESDLRQVLAALGFPEEDHDRPASQLSEGERRRLALAAVLAGTPELLVLDEPTNHLDLAARTWLAERLARWAGAVVVVSHDRAFLDRATNLTLFLGAGAPELRRGGYARARHAREHALEALRRLDAQREKEARRLRAMSEALARRGGRGAAKRRRAADRKAASLAAPALAAAAPRAENASWALRARGLGGPLLEGRALARGSLSVPYIRVLAGQRIALMGPNGSGKSTLLGLLAGSLHSTDPRAELRYAPGLRLAALTQLEKGLAPGVPVLEQLERLTTTSEARRLLAGAGLPASAWGRTPERLSGGERARAGLCLLEAREADLVLLDEPSNDLDLPAIEALQDALRDTAAAVVLATHDRRLAESVAEEVWALEDGSLRRYPDVAAYLAGRRPSGDAEPAPTGPAGAPGPEAPPPEGEPGAVSRLEALEDEVYTVERLLEDPLELPVRERERLRARLASLRDELGLAYDARCEPPAPRFRVRERGLDIVADRCRDGLVVMAVPGDAAARAMAALLRLEQGSGDDADRAAVGPWPWLRVRNSGSVAHLAVNEPREAWLLPWARAALADGAARHVFALLDASALQLFTREPLPGTRLRDAGGGWWTWTRDGFCRWQGLPESSGGKPPPRRRRRHRGRGPQPS